MDYTVRFKKRSYAVIALAVTFLTFLFAVIEIAYEQSMLSKYLDQRHKEFSSVVALANDCSTLASTEFDHMCINTSSNQRYIFSKSGVFDVFDSTEDFGGGVSKDIKIGARTYAVFSPIKTESRLYYFAYDITDFKSQNIQIIYFSIFGAIALMFAAAVAIRIGYSNLFFHIRELTNELSKQLVEAREGERSNASLLGEYMAAVDASNIVSKTDTKGIITYVNKSFCDVSGFTQEELLGEPQNIVRHPNMPKTVFKEMWETISQKKIYKGVIENRKKDGSSYFVDATIVPIVGLDGEIIEYLGIRHDITEFINNKQKLFTNSLTGLPNRYKLASDLHSVKNGHLAVVNIDSFKIINDYYGSDIGDMILVELAKRFSRVFSSSGFVVYKLSSDEYAIMCDECEGNFEEEILRGAQLATSDSIKCGDIDIVIAVTVGIASKQEGLLEKANMALGFAKSHKKHIAIYDDTMLISKNYEKNLVVSKTLREAIDGDWLVPYFQPIVDAKSGKTDKYETLVRIVKPTGEVMTPFEFLDVAKAIKLYPYITRTMIAKAFEIFKNKDEVFSINLSVEDILDEQTRAFVLGMLGGYGIANRVIFEILESEGIENYGEVSEFLCAAKKMGAKIAIDDFGSGYSNFEHLAKLNVDIIKIDGSLIKNIDVNKNSEIIVSTIVSFAKQLGMQSVAEFVHSEAVYAKVKEIGIDYAQGYLLGKPEAMDDKY